VEAEERTGNAKLPKKKNTKGGNFLPRLSRTAIYRDSRSARDKGEVVGAQDQRKRESVVFLKKSSDVGDAGRLKGVYSRTSAHPDPRKKKNHTGSKKNGG